MLSEPSRNGPLDPMNYVSLLAESSWLRELVCSATSMHYLPEVVAIFNQKLHVSFAFLLSFTIGAVVHEVHKRFSVRCACLTARDYKVIEDLREHPCHVLNTNVSIMS